MWTDLLEKFTAQLQQGCGTVWEALVRQGFVNACYHLTWWPLVIICFIACCKYDKKADCDEKRGPNDAMIALCISFVLMFTFLIIGLAHLDNVITGFINPEYYAFQRLERVFK